MYTFTTAKLQPLVTQPEGKNLIQACLNAPHGQLPSSMPVGTPLGRSSGPMSAPGPHSPSSPAPPPNVPGGLAIGGGKEDDSNDADSHDQPGAPPDVQDPAERGGRKRRRASSTTTAPTTRSSAQAAPPPPPPASSTSPSSTQPPPPPPPAATTSPHGRQTMPLPNAMAMPGSAPPQQQQMQPQSPSYAAYPGGDPNMYPGYGGQPQQGPPQGSPYGYVQPPPGHEQPPNNMTWGASGVQQNNHYGARR